MKIFHLCYPDYFIYLNYIYKIQKGEELGIPTNLWSVLQEFQQHSILKQSRHQAKFLKGNVPFHQSSTADGLKQGSDVRHETREDQTKNIFKAGLNWRVLAIYVEAELGQVSYKSPSDAWLFQTTAQLDLSGNASDRILPWCVDKGIYTAKEQNIHIYTRVELTS